MLASTGLAFLLEPFSARLFLVFRDVVVVLPGLGHLFDREEGGHGVVVVANHGVYGSSRTEDYMIYDILLRVCRR